MYSKNEVERAVERYHEIKHYQKTIDDLGYPTISMLWQWVHGNVPKSVRGNEKPRKK